MLGEWPLRLDGVECGMVKASRSGAYTLISAEGRYTGALKRISLYGGGRELALGVLAPEGEIVALRRRFTRSELAAFGAEPEYAAESGAAAGPPAAESGAAPAEDGEPPPEPEGELWYSAPDGTLSRFDGERTLVALPAENVRVPDWASGIVRRINGREYVVFPR